MRRVAALLVLVPMVAGCGAAASRDATVSPDVQAIAEESAKDSSHITVSYGGREYFSGEWDFVKNVGTFSLGWSAEEDGPDEIVTADATYTRINSAPFGGLTEKKWIKWESDDDGEIGLGNSLFGIAPSDPSQLLDLLKASSSVQQVGEGDERGAAVKRYRATLEVERAIRQLPTDEQESVRALLRLYAIGQKGELPLDLAVDDAGRLRRVDVDVPDEEKLSVEFFDYGVSVDPKPPAASEVLSRKEFGQLLEKLSDRCVAPDAGEQSDELRLCVGTERLGFSEAPND